MADTHDHEELLTSRQAAAIAGVPLRRLQKWVESHQLATVRRHPSTLISRQALDAFLQSRPPPTPIAIEDEESLLSAQQAAEIAQVHLHTVQKWVATGRLDAVRHRPKVLVARQALDAFLRNRTPSGREAAEADEATTQGEDHDSRPLLTAKQAADIARVHPASVRSWVREGRLATVQVQPIRIDPATLQAFLRERARPKKPPAPDFDRFDEVDVETDLVEHAMADDAERERVEMPPMPAIESPKDEVWQALVLTLQRQLTAAETREARLLNLLDAASKPTPQIPRRLKVGEMTLVHRVKRYLESVGRPQRAWQVQRALKLDKPPHRELSRLHGRGDIRRLRDGVYVALDQLSR